MLLAYKYRMCIKLATAKTAPVGIKAAFQRTCVDLRSLKIVNDQGFHKVSPPYRLWVWDEDLGDARVDLSLKD